MDDKTPIKLDICVVAHNEELHISNCLSSLQQAIALLSNRAQVTDMEVKVSIINNGSNDNSHIIIEAFCSERSHWSARHIELGDKANAFNVGLFECTSSNESLVIFIDGDCQIAPASLLAITEAYQHNPNAYLLAGVPRLIGNSSLATLHKTLQGEALSGNFYAVTPSFHQKIKNYGFKLPIGLIGDDSLLAWVASHNFKLSNGVQKGNILGVPGAIFDYHRLVPNSWRNIKLYIRRLQRYSLRHLQQKCIRKFLEINDEFSQLPECITELYNLHHPSHKRSEPLNKLFDTLAAREIKQHRPGKS